MTRLGLQTVTGMIDPSFVKVVDGHTHVWIDDVGALVKEPMILNKAPEIECELLTAKAVGIHMLIDCQPGGCGRNGRMLREMSERTGVEIIASTGFHLRHYYPAHASLFEMSADEATSCFISELTVGLFDEPGVRAGIIKTACENRFCKSPRKLFEAAIRAALVTGAAIEVHTERGADVEMIMAYMLDNGMPLDKLILCHMDKRPDFELHRDLALEGVRLEYDTFLRPKYTPEENGWRLLFQMIEAGYADSIILATDLADAKMWRSMGGSPGAAAFVEVIIRRLESAGVPQSIIAKLTGENIVTAATMQLN